MKSLCKMHEKPYMLLRAFFIYIWLTVLSVLSVTDTYYSVYLFCAVISVLCLYDNYKNCGTGSVSEQITVSVFSALFSLSVVLANYALFEPLSVIQNLFDLACCLTGGFFVAQSVLQCLLRRLPLKCGTGNRKHAGTVFFAVFFTVAGIDLAYLLFAHYPGTVTVDSLSTISEIIGDSPYSNIMPFWHTVTVKIFFDLGMHLFGDINAAIALFHSAQILFMAACLGYAVMTLYQVGVPVWFLAAVYAVYAFQPYNIVYSVILWKDIPFAAAGLLMIK